MPITIIERPEVFTDASLDASDPPLLIRSNAIGLLTHELRRYCKREVSGRSFLIAGHRGAGKTTLVLHACQELFKESDDGRFPLRPLLVMLQGPNLLPNEEDELPVAENVEKKDAAPKKISPMENVLRQITLGLYRALAREISKAFRKHAMGLASGPQFATGIQHSELIEFAAALELELDEYPGKSRLREFWRTAGALETGVLWPHSPGPDGAPSRVVSLLGRIAAAAAGKTFSSLLESFASFFAPNIMVPVRPLDQGLRELVALCSACEAYRRISGTFTSKQEDKQGAKAAEERKIETDLKGKEILRPIMPVIVGALAGTGVLATNVATGPQAAFAGALAALASSLAIKYSSSRSRERSATREDLFIPDLSVATLDRVLPVLIDRLHAAGLAPIFVIDELDKVERLSTRIPEMVRRLKKLVAENAFFCFLTDRTYYEEMRERELKKPYSIEHTYFTHQLFIIFRHRDLHNFLGEVLQPPDAPPDLAKASAPAVETAAVPPAERGAQNLIKLERDDCEVLPYVLLYAARMHSIDLRRELVLIRGEKGIVTLTAGAVQGGRRYGLELQMQVAIETLLDEEDMERELDRHPAFRRLAHDALYYLAERWEDADDNLDLSKRSLLKFKEYLCSRMTTDPPESKALAKAATAKTTPRTSKKIKTESPTITDLDLDFLWARVRDLAALLSSHKTLLTRARLRGVKPSVTSKGNVPVSLVTPNAPPPFPEVVLKAVSEDPLLARLDGSEHRYRWCWYPAGRPIPGAPASEKRPSSWQQHVEFIRAFEKGLSIVVEDGSVTFADLGTNLNIISTSPPWKIVQDAMTRLETLASRGSYGGQDEDADTVAKFDALLKRSAPTIAYALCAAEILRPWSKPEITTDTAQRLATISYTLSLQHYSEATIAKWMKELFQEIHSRFSTDEPPALSPVDDTGGIASWGRWVRTATERALEALRPTALKNWPDIRKRAWDHWYARLSGGDFAPVNLDSVICAWRGTGPWSYLTFPVEEMTVQKWSGALCGALNIGLASDAEQPPPWLALTALSHLGFADRDLRLENVVRLMESQRLSDLHVDAIRKWPRERAANPPQRSALVLSRSSKPTAVGAWKPDPAFPMLCLSRPQGEALLSEKRLGDLTKVLYPDMVIFDLSPPLLIGHEATSAMASEPRFPDNIEQGFWSAVPRRPPMSLGIPIVLPSEVPPPGTGYLCIINPQSSADVFHQLAQQDKMARGRPRRSPSSAA